MFVTSSEVGAPCFTSRGACVLLGSQFAASSLHRTGRMGMHSPPRLSLTSLVALPLWLYLAKGPKLQGLREGA